MLARAALVSITLLIACTGPRETPEPKPEPEPIVQENVDIEFPTTTYTWDAAAGDPSVPAELGGPGFTGEGWQTRMERAGLGDPNAPQGGEMIVGMLADWPATLRVMGKDFNVAFNYFARDILYDTLLDLDPVSLEFVPRLATHWQISDDRSTYRFRINPAARWSDGEEVTAEDVVATYRLQMDPTLLDPSAIQTFGKLKEPKAISKYIVEVEVNEENWRNFLYFSSSLWILPEHEIGQLTGAEYLDQYQFRYTTTTGPYEVKPDGINKGNSITITRRSDWWGEDNPVWDGFYNIGSFKWNVVKNPDLRFEKVKKGEIDYFLVPKAQWWAEDIPALEDVKRGLLVPRKFFTDAPHGTSGMALNMRHPPLDDVRVRKALQHLYDRETMIKKLYFDEYEELQSYYQGGVYQNPNNPPLPYDEVAAVELLEAAGYTEINDEGYRVKDGKELGFSVTYRSPLTERSLTIFQEAAKRAGIRLDLQLLTPAAHWKNVREKEYEIASMAWGALTFPNPESSWSSSLASQKDNNNITAFANPRVDALCKEYDREYDLQRRIEIIQEIDGIIYAAHPYVLGWYGPSQRVLFRNKFGMPEWGSSRYAEYDNLFHIWWVDPDKEKTLAAAAKDPSITMDAGPREIRFWQQWVAHQNATAGDAAGDEASDHGVDGGEDKE